MRWEDENEVPDQHGTYGASLLDPRWKIRRQEILKRDEFQCAYCGTDQALQVHHRQYHFSKKLNAFLEPWEYPDHLLQTVCKHCHQRGHRMYRVPTFSID